MAPATALLGLAALVQVCATLPDNYIAFEYPVGKPAWWYDIVDRPARPDRAGRLHRGLGPAGDGRRLQRRGASRYLPEEDKASSTDPHHRLKSAMTLGSRPACPHLSRAAKTARGGNDDHDERTGGSEMKIGKERGGPLRLVDRRTRWSPSSWCAVGPARLGPTGDSRSPVC